MRLSDVEIVTLLVTYRHEEPSFYPLLDHLQAISWTFRLPATQTPVMSAMSQSESNQRTPQSFLPAAMQQNLQHQHVPNNNTQAANINTILGTALQPGHMVTEPHDGTDAEMDGQMHEPEDMREGDDKTDDEAEDSDTNTKRTGTKQARKPHLQGRFSGRLETKADEKRLADECKLLGHLLGGIGKRGEKSRLTLAKIVRGIASGDVRRYCEGRENQLQVLTLRKRVRWTQEALASSDFSQFFVTSCIACCM